MTAVLTLTSCTPGQFVWAYVGEGSDLRFAFCDSSTVTSARITVSGRPDGYREGSQSTEWSGPRIFIPEGAVFAVNDLPEGWRQTGELDLSWEWQVIDVDLYDDQSLVGFGTFDHRDARADEWSLSPAPGLFTGTSNCAKPFEHEFEPRPQATVFEEGEY